MDLSEKDSSKHIWKMKIPGSLCAIAVWVGLLVVFILVTLVVYCIALWPTRTGTRTGKPPVTEEANRKLKERIQFLEVLIERKERQDTRHEDLDLDENGRFWSGGRFQVNPSPPSLQSGVETEESEDEVFSKMNSSRFGVGRLLPPKRSNFRDQVFGDSMNDRVVPSEVIRHKKQDTNRANARLPAPAEASLAYSNFIKLDPLNEPLVASNFTPKGQHIPSIQGGRCCAASGPASNRTHASEAGRAPQAAA